MRHSLLFRFALVFAAMPVLAARALTPAEMVSWQIVCDSAAAEAERYAASEFQSLFQQMTGASLPIVETAPSGARAIYIGPEAVARAGRKVNTEKLGEEGLRIRVGRKAVFIDGGRPRGTLYGVYEFFEELCGARFLTHDHTYFPANALTRELPRGPHRYQPPFAFRWSYYDETLRNHEFAARLRTNTVSDDPKLGGRTGLRLVIHNVASLVPPATYGAEHPEYYALIDGQRKLEMHGGGPQLCMTNPDVLEIVVNAVLEEIKKNPSAKNISIAHMDNEAYCTCDRCAAVDAREESHAGATLAFVNAVAERIEPLHPDVFLSTYAYQYTRKPPKHIRARPNVLIQLCSIECCQLHPIDDPDCPLNVEFCEDTRGWNQKADHVFMWHYNTNFSGYMLPFPNLRSIGRSVKFFEANKGLGVFKQAAGNGFSSELSDLRNYVMSRCLWKPGRDSWTEAEEFCRLHYQEAAQPILDYLAWYHNLVDAAGVHPTCFPTESALAINPETAPKIMAYFEQALATAESPEVRARVEKASLSAYRALLSTTSMKLQYEDGIRPDLAGVDPNLLDTYGDLCVRFGVTQESEHTANETYLEHTRKQHAGLRAALIENDLWRVIVLPEYNGRVAEMTYKPTGRNVTQAARSFSRFRYEDWVRQGEGPGAQSLLVYEMDAHPIKAVLTLTTPDGSRFERTVSLEGDAVRFETAMTAGTARMFDAQAHPEYDTGTASDDANIVSIYVKSPEWIHVNADWEHAQPTDAQTQNLRNAVSGGGFAYYTHAEKFGVEQRFEPSQYQSLGVYWSPSRRQINLEMFPIPINLEPGQQARYGYEVRYLASPPR